MLDFLLPVTLDLLTFIAIGAAILAVFFLLAPLVPQSWWLRHGNTFAQFSDLPSRARWSFRQRLICGGFYAFIMALSLTTYDLIHSQPARQHPASTLLGRIGFGLFTAVFTDVVGRWWARPRAMSHDS